MFNIPANLNKTSANAVRVLINEYRIAFGESLSCNHTPERADQLIHRASMILDLLEEYSVVRVD